MGHDKIRQHKTRQGTPIQYNTRQCNAIQYNTTQDNPIQRIAIYD